MLDPGCQILDKSKKNSLIADVINMFRLEGVCDNIKSPLAPLFEKGGTAYTPALLITAIGVLIHLQAFISSPFDKGGSGGFNKKANRNIFLTIIIYTR